MAKNEQQGGKSASEIAALERAIAKGLGHATAKAEAFGGKSTKKPDSGSKK